MTVAVPFALIVLIGTLTLVSYVDRVYQEAGKFLSREFQDNIDVFEQKVEPGWESAAPARRCPWLC